jgi:hypothetical protein
VVTCGDEGVNERKERSGIENGIDLEGSTEYAEFDKRHGDTRWSEGEGIGALREWSVEIELSV